MKYFRYFGKLYLAYTCVMGNTESNWTELKLERTGLGRVEMKKF